MPWAMFGDTRPFEKNSDQTVMRQWWNSDAFDLSNLMSLASFWDVIDHFVAFNNALEVWLLSSDQTVMRQWWICDATVMPYIWASLCDLQGSDMSLIIFYPFAMPWGCVWWHKTSDETVMEQWWDSDQTMMPLISALYDNFKLLRNLWSNFILQQCLGSVFGDTRPFDKNSDQTEMRQ
jgi:hypothetical protein